MYRGGDIQKMIIFGTTEPKVQNEDITRFLEWSLETAKNRIRLLGYIVTFIGEPPERMERLRKPILSALTDTTFYPWFLRPHYDFLINDGLTILGDRSPIREYMQQVVPDLEELGHAYGCIRIVDRNVRVVKRDLVTIEQKILESYRIIEENRRSVGQMDREIKELTGILGNPKDAAKAVAKVGFCQQKKLRAEREIGRRDQVCSSFNTLAVSQTYALDEAEKLLGKALSSYHSIWGGVMRHMYEIFVFLDNITTTYNSRKQDKIVSDTLDIMGRGIGGFYETS